jgi:hypothetical protein
LVSGNSAISAIAAARSSLIRPADCCGPWASAPESAPPSWETRTCWGFNGVFASFRDLNPWRRSAFGQVAEPRCGRL